jgi:hypothetical protein
MVRAKLVSEDELLEEEEEELSPSAPTLLFTGFILEEYNFSFCPPLG